MNINPFAVQAPDSVEHTISNANATCVRFNRGQGVFAGHYMAAGRTDGLVIVLSAETKGLLRMFEGHVKAITSVSWSPFNRFLASSSLDGNVIVWDLKTSRRAHTLRFDAPVSSVQFSGISSKCLIVVLQTQECIVVDLKRQKACSTANGHATSSNGHNSSSAGSIRPTIERRTTLHPGQDVNGSISSAAFATDGHTIVCGTTKGDLLVYEAKSKERILRFDTGSSAVREITFARMGKAFVINSNDRSVRLFSYTTESEKEGKEGLRASIALLHRMQDLINRTPWFGIGFSGDGEYMFGGATHKAAHNIYIWDRGTGVLDKILQGPRDSLIEVDWHPNRPMLASVSHTGAINVWFNTPTEIWSAYAPGFEELEENEVYGEREDEFDLEDEEEVTRRKQDEEGVDVDIFPSSTEHKWKRSTGAASVTQMDHSSDNDLIDDDDNDDDDDDDDDEEFAIPVRLSLDLPDLDVED